MTRAMKIIKKITSILFILVLIGFGIGFYFLQFTEQELLGNRFVGFSVLIAVFIVVPLFLVIRLRGKKLKDYTLTQDNIKKWRKRLDE
ncbi:MAG TPA: hypothetical protein VK021_07155 [Flavobacteriaceae bacterium]|nr:hypothetical protein [Flavobacteriaceae bacterium]